MTNDPKITPNTIHQSIFYFCSFRLHKIRYKELNKSNMYKRKQVHQNRFYVITQHSIQWNAHSVVEGLSDTEVLFLRIKRGVQ